jgi:hypothetical protein
MRPSLVASAASASASVASGFESWVSLAPHLFTHNHTIIIVVIVKLMSPDGLFTWLAMACRGKSERTSKQACCAKAQPKQSNGSRSSCNHYQTLMMMKNSYLVRRLVPLPFAVAVCLLLLLLLLMLLLLQQDAPPQSVYRHVHHHHQQPQQLPS